VKRLHSALWAVGIVAATSTALADTKPTNDGAPAAGADKPASDSPKQPASTTRTYGLPEVLKLADDNHPNIREARAELAMVRAQLDEAHWAPYSQFKLTGGVTLAPEIRGSDVFSPNTDVSLSSSLGVAWKVGIDGVLPLWTFGKIGNLWDAADANVKVHEADVEKARDIVRLDVRRAYYALQLARDAKVLLSEARSTIEKGEKTLQEKIDKDEGDPIDLLQLQTFAAELDVREAEADKFVTVSLTGLRFYTGVKDLDIPDEPLAPPRHQLEPVENYQDVAQRARPELQQARAGLAAREAQTRLAVSNFYPDIGIALSVGFAAAPEIDDQLNPFVVDPANYFHYGAALVFQWNLDFLPKSAQLRQAEAQLTQMRATQSFAEGGVKSEIELAYADVVAFKKERDAYEKAVKTAKKWLIRVQQGIDVGIIEEKELLEPAKQYALNRFNMLNATMELDVAMAKLARASGWDSIAPDGT
jgi:outer membrane protein TolC